LLDQRRRNQVGRRRHDHLVERGVLGPTVIPIGRFRIPRPVKFLCNATS
jgi:hypothetical protein